MCATGHPAGPVGGHPGHLTKTQQPPCTTSTSLRNNSYCEGPPPWIVQACPLSLYTIIPVDSIFYQLTMITFVRSAALSWKYHVSCPCWRQNHKWWGCGSTPLYGPGAELLGLNNCSRRESDRETKKRPRLLRYRSSSKDKPEKVGPNLTRWNVFLNLNGESRLHRRLEKYLPPFFRRWRQSRDALDRRRLNPPTDWRWRRDLTYCLLTRLGSSTNLLAL